MRGVLRVRSLSYCKCDRYGCFRFSHFNNVDDFGFTLIEQRARLYLKSLKVSLDLGIIRVAQPIFNITRNEVYWRIVDLMPHYSC